MNTIPSAQFRKRYATLTEPTLVTVNGHTIGQWTPRDHLAIPRGEFPPVVPGMVYPAGFGTSHPAPKPKR